jgi:bacillithiol biosynthesis cysteine-adding enzyme BshC
MKVHQIPFQETGYFSKLICDYLNKENNLTNFYGNFPDIDGFKKQLKLKSNFSKDKRQILVESLQNQYNGFDKKDIVSENIHLLKFENTFTITTGHQLNLFTGPLYFLYKIICAINLAKKLKFEFPQYNFIPIYWMATEDHDFEEINFFNLNNNKIEWKRDFGGAVGRLKTNRLEPVFEDFVQHLNNSRNANFLKNLFKDAYFKHENLAQASRFIVNKLFGENGLVIVDGDDKDLKQIFKPIVKEELISQTSFKEVIKTNNKLEESYSIQVNPREINLFYLKDSIRERILFDGNLYTINNTDIRFSKIEILEELNSYPDRFSPNVIMRPIYQETILPNLCYIGGGGELAYWFQLKGYFESQETVFPILLLRNSGLLVSEKQMRKIEKLNLSLNEVFNKQEPLINSKVKEISKIKIDFSDQKAFLKQQFVDLKELAKETDTSFLGAVNAQEKKQLNGLDKLEKRLLKAQKRRLVDKVNRIRAIQDALFPNQSLEERYRNFSEYYLEMGTELFSVLFDGFDPLALEFSVVEY